MEVGDPTEVGSEARPLDGAGERLIAEAGLVSKEVDPAGLDLPAQPINHIDGRDGAGRGDVKRFLQVDFTLHHSAHQLGEIRNENLGEAAWLQHVEEAAQYLGHVMAKIMLQVM